MITSAEELPVHFRCQYFKYYRNETENNPEVRTPRCAYLSKRRGKRKRMFQAKSETPMKDDQLRATQPKRTSSRHERHKCHKSKHKAIETLQLANQKLMDRISNLKRENHLLTKKLSESAMSLDSGLSTNDVLSPFEVDVSSAYHHVKSENAKLLQELEAMQSRYDKMKTDAQEVEREKKDLEVDVDMLKNLVYKLNVELERCQTGGGNKETTRPEILPKNYQKNFLKPVLPLLRAYSEAVQEKADIIDNFEADMKKFGVIFNDLFKENEKLYMELEKKMNTVEGDALREVNALRKELEMGKQENSLLISQIELEQEKLAEVHSVYRMKVAEVLKQNQAVNESLQDQKAELCTIKGKYEILKQEYDRVKLDNDSRVSMAVHSASIGECKRLFQELKTEYEMEKQQNLATISEQEQMLARMRREWGEASTERNRLEKCTAENETLRRRLTEMEKERPGELTHIRKQLRESNAKVEELSNKLTNSKKQLHKAMSFAEDIVREQESLLMQLHAKQKENSFMATQFGSLKKQLKSVEKGAQEGLDCVEEKMKNLEAENLKLKCDVKKLQNLLKEKNEIIESLEQGKSSCS